MRSSWTFNPQVFGYEQPDEIRDTPILDDLEAADWVQAYNAAWLNRDWTYLESCLALDVEFRSRNSATVVGRTAVLAELRELMDRTWVHEYNATDLAGRSVGALGVIRYRWQSDWTCGGEHHSSNGRDVLVLRIANHRWQLRARIRRDLDERRGQDAAASTSK
jgi:Domain of unknown function (DUF4440)